MPIEIEVECRVDWSDEFRIFIAQCNDYPHITGEGRTPLEAAKGLKEGVTKWLNLLKNQSFKLDALP
jgi:hypothetical protein